MDSIESCLGISQEEKVNSYKRRKITLAEYGKSIGTLTFIDFLLVMFLVSILVGIIMASNERLRDTSHSLIQIGFLGMISFITVTTMNKKIQTDICFSCQGKNPMKYERRLNVLFSFIWATIQTFNAIFLNVIYFFLAFFVLYLCLRSHVIYRHTRENETRGLLLLHKVLQSQSGDPIPKHVIAIIYWVVIIACIIGVLFFLSILIANAVTDGKNDIVEKIIKVFTQYNWIYILVPFVCIGITLGLSFLYEKNIDFIDKSVIHNVLPSLEMTNITKHFGLGITNVRRKHIVTFILAIILSALFALLFLKPVNRTKTICDKEGQIQNDDATFSEFKHRFVTGHYLVGVIIVLALIAFFGKIQVTGTLIFVFILILVVKTFVMYAQDKENADTDDEL